MCKILNRIIVPLSAMPFLNTQDGQKNMKFIFNRDIMQELIWKVGGTLMQIMGTYWGTFYTPS